MCYKSDETIITDESCLSVPNKTIKVERSKTIMIIDDKSTNKNKWKNGMKFTGMDAIVIQHEIDHLNGIIITDREL